MKKNEMNSRKNTAIILNSLNIFIKSELKKIYILFNVLLIFIIIMTTFSVIMIKVFMLILKMIYVNSLAI